MERSKRTVTGVIVFLAFFHQVGLVGLHLESTRALFSQLIPLNLILSVGLLSVFHRPLTLRFGIFAFIIFWAGYIVELAGVYTGLIFGHYEYGASLGFKVAGVPPLIGLNWLMLLYCTGIISQQLPANIWLRSAVGAFLMTFLDMLIEPMAMEYDMWSWQNGQIPIHNFIGWLLVSFMMQYAFHSLEEEKENPIAVPLYLILLVFFGAFIVIRL
ncbi:MAG: carotenoid biosynthesis protein [Bacteroidetes bacterium]|nr:MAG: carotenoid biosynthesis protein [Bacteroidota bacterium]